MSKMKKTNLVRMKTKRKMKRKTNAKFPKKTRVDDAVVVVDYSNSSWMCSYER